MWFIFVFRKIVIYICQPVWTQKACHQSLFPGKVPSTQPDDDDDDDDDNDDDGDDDDDDHADDSNDDADDDDADNSDDDGHGMLRMAKILEIADGNWLWIREVFNQSWSKIQENPKPPSNLPVLVSK